MLRIFWDTAVRLDPKAVYLDDGQRFPLCDPEALDSLFRRAGPKLHPFAFPGQAAPTPR